MKLFSLAFIKTAITFIFFLSISFVLFPFTVSVFEIAKWWILSSCAGLLLIITAWEILKYKHFTLSLTPYTASFFMLAIASLASSFLASTNKWEALSTYFGPMTFLSLAIISSVGFSEFTLKIQKLFTGLLFSIGAILGLVALYQALGIGKMLADILPLTANTLFTPVGSTYTLLTILCIVFPLIVTSCIRSLVDKEDTGARSWIVLLLVSLGIGTTLWQLVYTKETSLPTGVGWSIFLEQWKQIDTLFLGVGPDNYLTAFTLGKPLWVNSQTFWNTRFPLSSNFLFHIGTIFGLLGIIAMLPLLQAMLMPLYTFISQPKHRLPLGITLSVTSNLIGLLIAPPNIVLLSFTIATMALWYPTLKNKQTYVLSRFINRAVVSICLFTLGIFFLSYSTKILIADTYFYRGINENTHKNLQKSYQLLEQAVFWNTTKPEYRIVYSQINASLADILFAQQSNTNTQGEHTDSDSQAISQIIQQAVREAKIAAALAPKDVRVWENLARLYSAIAPVTQGADSWIESSFQKAIALDPKNPALATEYGNYLFAKKQIDPAIQAYIQAINYKNDYPDAHFNIGFVLTAKKQYFAAFQAFASALNLLPSSSQEYKETQKQLAQLQQFLTSEEKQRLLPGKTIDYSLPNQLPVSEETNPQSVIPQVGTEEQVNQRFPQLPPTPTNPISN